MDKLTVRTGLVFAFIAFFSSAAQSLFGADQRTESIDAYILIDTSRSMESSVNDAVDWICARIVDDILIPGDRVSVWTFSKTTTRLVERVTLGQDSKAKIKEEIRKAAGDGEAPNISDALRTLLSEAEARQDPKPLAYVIVAGSLIEGDKDATDKLLKYSKVEDHPGWKAVVVGVGIEKRVAESARLYLQESGSR